MDATVEDIPVPGQFDDEIEHWEVEARGSGRGLLALTISVDLMTPGGRAIVEAANAESMDAQQFLQRKVDQLGETLHARQNTAPAANSSSTSST